MTANGRNGESPAQAHRSRRFIIDCSDKRNEYLYRALSGMGCSVGVYGSGAAGYGDCGVNPRQYVYLFAPATDVSANAAADFPTGSTVFCFRIEPETERALKEREIRVCKYFDDELLAMRNAYLTAEGALACIIDETDISLRGMRALVLGGGRVGKCTCKVLHDNRSRVSVATGDPVEYAYASIFAGEVFTLGQLSDVISGFRVIVNTIPSLVLTAELLSRADKDCFILDLASKPGGVDFEAAKSLHIKTRHALGLPGKTAPLTAAEHILASVFARL